jgi:hypothetical protein
MRDQTNLLQWTEWRPLIGAWRDPDIPRTPGLYRICRVGRDDVDYIGQTGDLRERFGALRGVFAEQMPYAAPHTAGPGLWALRHASDCLFEISVALVDGSEQWRRGMEAVAIALYRQEHCRSPTVQFGRIPVGYLASSGNDARLVSTRKRFHGGPSPLSHVKQQPGLAPLGPLTGDPQALNWGTHSWSAWVSLRDLTPRATARGSGLYRFRGRVPSALLYIGEGRIPNRPRAHVAKMKRPDHRLGRIFAGQERLECSWVINESWLPHQREELENDLIAAHVLKTGTVPIGQFLGEPRHVAD